MRRFLGCFGVVLILGCGSTGSEDTAMIGGSDVVQESDSANTTEGDVTDDASDDLGQGIDTFTAVEPLIAVPPCGDDLQASCGSIVADIPEPPASGVYPHDVTTAGPYGVLSESATIPVHDGTEVGATIYWPTEADIALEDVLPLVLLMPGFPVSHTDYLHLTEHMVSHGLAVVGVDVTVGTMFDPAQHDVDAAKVSDVIDWIASDSVWSQRFDLERIASVGHSAGGKMSFYAASLDPRIDLVAAWDPSNSGGPPCFLGDLAGGSCNDFAVAPNCEADDSGRLHLIQAESLIFGAQDMTLTPDTHLHADRFFYGAPSPTAFISMPDVGHQDWAVASETSSLSIAVSTAWLLTRLMGAEGLESGLPTGEIVTGSDLVDAVYTK